jgi:hypothetical protein
MGGGKEAFPSKGSRKNIFPSFINSSLKELL